ncbi:MAG: Crp/Fnr family transcriptional regulator [Clostridia bacterium]|nr:Crp/Fnr family transcriptional regulator [Clostridia bacterium]
MTQIRQCMLFDRIDDEGLLKTLNCLNVQIIACEKGKVIFHQGDTPKYFGVVLSGSVHVTLTHSSGEQNVIGAVDAGDLFAETCVCAGEDMIPASFIAARDSVVMLLDHARVITGCRNNGCLAHSLLVTNLMRSVARKNLLLAQKLSIVTKRTTRGKLMSYLEAQKKPYAAGWFTIPFDRQTLADYLGVDRSAMCAELSRMKKDGLIDFRKNEFKLCGLPVWQEPAAHNEGTEH